MNLSEPTLVLQSGDTLGEAVVWLSTLGLVAWVDIEGRTLHTLSLGNSKTMSWRLPLRPTAIAHWHETLLLLAVEDGLASFDLADGGFRHLLQLCDPRSGMRMNDGATDTKGRFWFGSMDEVGGGKRGKIYCLHRDGSVSIVFEGIGISNGLAFSRDGDVVYFSDSASGEIFACDIDQTSGQILSSNLFCKADAAPGVPDGAAIDSDGYLYSCRWDGWGIARFSPYGELDRLIRLPVQRPTRCAFGGADRRALYISSARVELTPVELQNQPYAGGLFCIQGFAVGAPMQNSFAGSRGSFNHARTAPRCEPIVLNKA